MKWKLWPTMIYLQFDSAFWRITNCILVFFIHFVVPSNITAYLPFIVRQNKLSRVFKTCLKKWILYNISYSLLDFVEWWKGKNSLKKGVNRSVVWISWPWGKHTIYCGLNECLENLFSYSYHSWEPFSTKQCLISDVWKDIKNIGFWCCKLYVIFILSNWDSPSYTFFCRLVWLLMNWICEWKSYP